MWVCRGSLSTELCSIGRKTGEAKAGMAGGAAAKVERVLFSPIWFRLFI